MLEILQFCLGGFWVFVGSVIIFSMIIALTYSIIIGIGWSLAKIVLAMRGKDGNPPPSISL